MHFSTILPDRPNAGLSERNKKYLAWFIYIKFNVYIYKLISEVNNIFFCSVFNSFYQ